MISSSSSEQFFVDVEPLKKYWVIKTYKFNSIPIFTFSRRKRKDRDFEHFTHPAEISHNFYSTLKALTNATLISLIKTPEIINMEFLLPALWKVQLRLCFCSDCIFDTSI